VWKSARFLRLHNRTHRHNTAVRVHCDFRKTDLPCSTHPSANHFLARARSLPISHATFDKYRAINYPSYAVYAHIYRYMYTTTTYRSADDEGKTSSTIIYFQKRITNLTFMCRVRHRGRQTLCRSRSILRIVINSIRAQFIRNLSRTRAFTFFEYCTHALRYVLTGAR